MKVVTPFEVADCNTELLRAGVPCRVHLTDACGAEKERLDEAHAVIVEFFEKKGAKPRFDETGTYFTLQ